MKSLVTSLLVLLILTAIVITNAIFVNLILGSIEDRLEGIESSVNDYELLYKDYMQKERYLSLTIEDGILLEIERSFVECIESARSEDEGGVAIGKSRLLCDISHIRRLSSFNIKSVM